MRQSSKIICIVTGMTILAGATIQAAAPDKAAAKWLGWTRARVESQQAAEPVSSAPQDTVAVYNNQEVSADSSVISVAHANETIKVPAPSIAATASKYVAAVKTIYTSQTKKPDVGPGVEGLDYAKVIKWQQAVDEGRELWRLDPVQVAEREGRQYGFTADDKFTIVRRQSSSAIARHGQIDVQVVHQNKVYTMILVRPFGSDDGAIWTTYKVLQKDTEPAPVPPAGKVLFQTDKFTDWYWHKGAYPRDMAFATVVDYAAQLKYDQRIPEFVLARAKDVDYQRKVVLFAYLGTGGGADGIGIEKVTLQGDNITVVVRTKSIRPGEVETKNITHPADFVTIDRSIVDIWGGVNVTFVGQDGKILSKNKLVIEHRRQ
jgi:hypothetical protein